jgi:mono/diheme cytochrome c family protein
MRNVSLSASVVVMAFFAVMVLATPRPAYSQDPAHVKHGETVFAAQKCSMCHSVAGKGSKVSPLDGVGKKLTAEELRAWIVDPAGMTAKTKSTKKPPMPNRYAKLPAADIDGLVAYLQSLK